MSGQRIFELLKDGANERDIINEIDIFVSEGGDINVIGGGRGRACVGQHRRENSEYYTGTSYSQEL
jgi:hypothetical protein